MQQNSWKFIESEDGLIELCDAINQWDRPLPLDLEADSMHCYHSKICLIQITVSDQNYIIDPLKVQDLSPLLESLKDKTLILHGSDYDLRMMRDNWNFSPSAVWDTMIAARYMGEPQFGLASVILKYFDVTLDKTSQKADWSKRPLSTEMLDYAALDTQYLSELHKIQHDKLSELNRLNWLEEHCIHLIEQVQNEVQVIDPDRWRIKGSSLLNRKQLAILNKVWEWREVRAEQRDNPPYKVLANEKMIHLCKTASASNQFNLAKLGRMPKNLSEMVLEQLVEKINEALQMDPEDYPHKKKRFISQVASPHPQIMEALKLYRETKSAEFGIDEALLANRHQLVHLALYLPKKIEEMDNVFLMNWQWDFWQPELNRITKN